MAEMTKTRINFKADYNKIVKHSYTISELAELHNLTEEEYNREMDLGLGPKMAPNARKASERNERYRRQNQKSAEKKRAYNKKVTEAAKAKAQGGNIQESEKMEKGTTAVTTSVGHNEEVTDKKCSEMERLVGKKQRIIVEIESAKKLVKAAEQFAKVKEGEIVEAQEKFDFAKRMLEEAEKASKEAEESFQKENKKLDGWKKDLEDIEQEIIKLQSNKIYLIAPKYKGKVPEFGKFISSEKISGVEVEVQKGEILLNEPTFNALLESGYKQLDEYLGALEFAKLCILFETSNEEYSILVDDERMKKVLKFQDIVVKEESAKA